MSDFEEFSTAYDYDPDTGRITRRKTGNVIAGKSTAGYIIVRYKKKSWYAHRIAWLLETGAWPSHQIDHINGNRSDNSFANLRDVSHQHNVHNRNKTFGATAFLGVSFHKASGKYNAQIYVDGRNKSLGLFHAPEEAHAAYMAAKEEFHAGFVKNNE